MNSAQAFERGDVRVYEAEPNDGPVVSGPLRTRTKEQMDYAQLWGGKIGLLLLEENDEALDAMIVQAKAARRRQNHGSVLKVPLATVGFSIRNCNILEQEHSVRTVEEFLSIEMGHLDATPKLGPASTRNMLCILCKFLLKVVLEYEGAHS